MCKSNKNGCGKGCGICGGSKPEAEVPESTQKDGVLRYLVVIGNYKIHFNREDYLKLMSLSVGLHVAAGLLYMIEKEPEKYVIEWDPLRTNFKFGKIVNTGDLIKPRTSQMVKAMNAKFNNPEGIVASINSDLAVDDLAGILQTMNIKFKTTHCATLPQECFIKKNIVIEPILHSCMELMTSDGDLELRKVARIVDTKNVLHVVNQGITFDPDAILPVNKELTGMENDLPLAARSIIQIAKTAINFASNLDAAYTLIYPPVPDEENA